MQRNTTFTIPLGTRNLSTPETTTNLNLDAFGSLAHGVLYRALHSTTEHHTTLQLSGNVLRYQAGIQIRLADFFDVDVDGNAHHFANFTTQAINIFTLLTDNNTGAGSMNRDSGVLSRALDHNLADRRLYKTFVQELTNLNVVQQVFRVFPFLGIPN